MERKKANNTKKNLKNMTRDQIQEALKRKKEGNAKALEIVEEFIDINPFNDLFLSKLFDINQNHYQDIVEERSLLKKCGYPICRGMLGNIPKKQYHISTIHNRVFDITERKNFCSNECFKCSNFIKDQMLTSPLWMRDTEKKPNFILLPCSKREKDYTGHEVDLGHKRVKPNDIEKPITPENKTICEEETLEISENSVKDTSYQNKTEIDAEIQHESIQDENVSINSQIDDVNKSNEAIGKTEISEDDTFVFPVNVIKENLNNIKPTSNKIPLTETTESCSQNEINNKKATHCTDQINEIISDISERLKDSNISEEIINDDKSVPIKYVVENKIDEHVSVCSTSSKNEQSTEIKSLKRSSTEKDISKPKDKLKSKILFLESCLKEWITIDTLILTLGEKAIQDFLLEKNKTMKLNETMKTNETYDKYVAICKKLSMLELLEEREDSKLIKSKPEQPLPDIEQLRKQTENMMIKVNEFFKGDVKKVTFEEPIKEETPGDNNEDEGSPVIIPSIDLHAQNALRRKIVMDKLNRIIPDVLRMLGATYLTVNTELRTLIKTFKLSAHNIMFQTAEWNLIAVILLKLLSLKDSNLKEILSSGIGRKHLTLLSMSYHLDPGYIDRLMLWLLDAEYVIGSSC